jgi:hypothetical protein
MPHGAGQRDVAVARERRVLVDLQLDDAAREEALAVGEVRGLRGGIGRGVDGPDGRIGLRAAVAAAAPDDREGNQKATDA